MSEEHWGSEAKCPHCGFEYGDTWEIFIRSDADDVAEVECPECEKRFEVERRVSVDYISRILEAS